MIGDTRFSFLGTPRTRYMVSVGAARVQIRYETGQQGHSQSWDVNFADLSGATLDSWSSKRGTGEAVYLHRKAGPDASFLSVVRPKDKDVSQENRESYEAAAAAVFRALAVARPDLKVRKGPTPATRIVSAVILMVMTAILTGLYLWQTEDVRDEVRYPIVGVIAIMMVLQAFYRTRIFKNAPSVGVREVATETASRVPIIGPWGAVPIAQASVD